MAEERKSIKELFATLPTRSAVQVINNERVCGFAISWVEEGFGFVVIDKKTGEVCGDLEAMDPEHIGRILMRLVGETVREPEQPEEETP